MMPRVEKDWISVSIGGMFGKKQTVIAKASRALTIRGTVEAEKVINAIKKPPIRHNGHTMESIELSINGSRKFIPMSAPLQLKPNALVT